ncbi:hypothetical protein CRUP_027384, partial [Coryphaenoides rupestris]
SSAEVSRDSGVVSQSASSLSVLSDVLLSSSSSSSSFSFGGGGGGGAAGGGAGGAVSQSPSFNDPIPPPLPPPPIPAPPPPPGCVATGDPEQEDSEADDALLRHTALSYSSYVRANAGEEVLCLDKSLEEMLTRVDEFVGMLDMIRNDTSQIVNDNLPQIQRKSDEMRQIYQRIDKLEAFVKMVGSNVGDMEEQVTLAEGELGTLPGAFKKILRTMSVPGFLNKPASPRRPAYHQQQVPSVFRTDDYFMPTTQPQ